MSDLDPIIATALRARADGDVRIDSLLEGARRSGARHRRNRRLAVSASAAVVVAVLLAAVVLLPRQFSGPPANTHTPTPATTASPTTVAPSPTPPERPRPPEVPGMRPLAGGGQLGEGRQLHLDTADPDVIETSWGSGEGEEMSVTRNPRTPYLYEHYEVAGRPTEGARDAMADADRAHREGTEHTDDLAVTGRPATLEWGPDWAALRWRPVDTAWLYAVVSFQEREPDATKAAERARGAVLEVAGFLRLDKVRQCAVEFHLTWSLSDTHLASCATTWTATGKVIMATAGFRLAGGSPFLITDTVATDPPHVNTTYDGKGLEYDPTNGATIWLDGHQYTFERRQSGLPEEPILHMLTSLERTAPTTDPLAR
ncbi:hypothetical protein [Dactylosporangium salmoneum]|uniref:Uncharacterized protein n=1 Tax=Dactylosporangium salmoneum TaxID=53361 RepID=A0ABP5TE54_9ACTN